MAYIYLLRHAQSVANANQIASGSRDNSPLSALGRLQAKLAGDNAVEFKFDLIVSSPLLRAQETAGIVAEALNYPTENILVIDSLRERDLGELDGKSYTKLPAYDGNHEDIEGRTSGLETLEAFFDRAEQVLAILEQRPEQRILVVCHNGIGRMIKVAAKNGKPAELYQQPRLSNAVIYAL